MKHVVGITVILVILGSVGLVFGHPPKKVDGEFDLESHLLKVVVSHDSKDAVKHFINEIEVKLNGKEIIEQEFGSQQDRSVQEVVYKIIDAKAGDKIEIVAGCNISGKKKAALTVEKPEPAEKEATKEEG
jgi:hypothetical protein